VDNDPQRFSVAELQKWKNDAEAETEKKIGKSPDLGIKEDLAAVARVSLLDQRFQMAKEDYLRRGSPKHMIDTFTDLTREEKAELYDRVIQWRKGRPSKSNPYR